MRRNLLVKFRSLSSGQSIESDSDPSVQIDMSNRLKKKEGELKRRLKLRKLGKKEL